MANSVMEDRRLPNAYAMLGHACDINTEAGLQKLIVPDGCAYVTLAECGYLSFYSLKMMFTLEHMNLRVHELMRDPVRNKVELEQYFECKLDVRGPGEEYINSFNTLIFDSDTNKKLYKSGLYEVGKPFSPINMTDIFARYAYYSADTRFTDDQVYNIYNDSIYPTDFDIMSEFFVSPVQMDALKGIMAKIVNRSVRDMFIERPGVYYNFACRTLCNKVSRNIAANEREGPNRNRMTNVTPNVNSQILSFNNEAYMTHMRNWVQARLSDGIRGGNRPRRKQSRRNLKKKKRYTVRKTLRR